MRLAGCHATSPYFRYAFPSAAPRAVRPRERHAPQTASPPTPVANSFRLCLGTACRHSSLHNLTRSDRCHAERRCDLPSPIHLIHGNRLTESSVEIPAWFHRGLAAPWRSRRGPRPPCPHGGRENPSVRGRAAPAEATRSRQVKRSGFCLQVRAVARSLAGCGRPMHTSHMQQPFED